MAGLASFKDLCLDAADAQVVGAFWAAALGQELQDLGDGDTCVVGPRFLQLWVNTVPEPKIAKNRVHLDLFVPDLEALLALGAHVVADHDEDEWVVLADPEGNEFCAFPDEAGEVETGVPAKAYAICVDSDQPVEMAAWWQARLGGTIGPGSDGRPRWLHHANGLGELTLKFVPVADQRVAKNRCHWDIITADLEGLVAAGAKLLRRPDGTIDWTVLRDPDGNEFCAFEPRPG
jgi:Glyoxalase-like domain